MNSKKNADVIKNVGVKRRCKTKAHIKFKRIRVNTDFCKVEDKIIFKNVKYTEKWKKRIQSLLNGAYSIPKYYEYFLGSGLNKETFVLGIHRDEKEKDFVFFSDDYNAQYRKVTDLNSPNFGLENLSVEKIGKQGTQPCRTSDIRIKGNGQVAYIYAEQNSSNGQKGKNKSVEIIRADEKQAYNIYELIYGKENNDKKKYIGIPEKYKKGYYIYQKVKDEDGNISSVYEHYPEEGKPAARIKISNIGGNINFKFDPDKNVYLAHRGELSCSSVAKWVEENGCPELKETLLSMFKEKDLAMPKGIKYIFDELDEYVNPLESSIR